MQGIQKNPYDIPLNTIKGLYDVSKTVIDKGWDELQGLFLLQNPKPTLEQLTNYELEFLDSLVTLMINALKNSETFTPDDVMVIESYFRDIILEDIDRVLEERSSQKTTSTVDVNPILDHHPEIHISTDIPVPVSDKSETKENPIIKVRSSESGTLGGGILEVYRQDSSEAFKIDVGCDEIFANVLARHLSLPIISFEIVPATHPTIQVCVKEFSSEIELGMMGKLTQKNVSCTCMKMPYISGNNLKDIEDDMSESFGTPTMRSLGEMLAFSVFTLNNDQLPFVDLLESYDGEPEDLLDKHVEGNAENVYFDAQHNVYAIDNCVVCVLEKDFAQLNESVAPIITELQKFLDNSPDGSEYPYRTIKEFLEDNAPNATISNEALGEFKAGFTTMVNNIQNLTPQAIAQLLEKNITPELDPTKESKLILDTLSKTLAAFKLLK